ncbi:protein of unknown function DUF748 [Desulfovibrio sp. X2]|uniref:DUF748 domain-containing protein n=1 Tax=Desulfovibrio sp. X2 TaxID=941449 RepID=UPI000358AAD4|nr:DUF748 domain-containing protein [Desulfovibrio sp. X2]EPR43474.1 protein of unknown function DUF748 [Desulfovibrio sp. X2]
MRREIGTSLAAAWARVRRLWSSRRVRRWVLWAAGAVAAWGLLAGLALPPVLRSQMEARLSDVLGVHCTVESVHFNPYTLRLSVENVRVPQPSGEGEALTLGALEVAPSLSSVLHFAPMLAHVRLVDPVLHVTRFAGGRFSFSPFLADGEGEAEKAGPEARTGDAQTGDAQAGDAHTAEEGQKEAQKTAPLFPFAVSDFEIRNGTVIFNDAPLKTVHTIKDLHLVVPFTSTLESDRDRAIVPRLTAVVDGRPLDVTGRLLPFADHPRTEFDVAAGEVDLTRYSGYLADVTPLRLESGMVGADLKLVAEQSAERGVDFSLSGTLNLRNLRVDAPSGKGTVFGLTSGRVEVERFSLSDRRLDVSLAELNGLSARAVRMADGQVDWETYFTTPPESAGGSAAAAPEPGPGAKAAPERPFVTAVREAEVRDGTLVWKDETVPGGAQVRLGSLAATLKDFSTPGGPGASGPAAKGGGAFTLSLRVDGGDSGKGAGKAGSLTAEGDLALAPFGLSLHLDASALPLPLARGYLAQALPLSLDAGTADVRGEIGFTEAASAQSAKADKGAKSPKSPKSPASDASGEPGPGLTVRKGAVQLANLSLSRDGQTPALTLGTLDVPDVSLDLAARTVSTGPVVLTKPEVRLARDEDGSVGLFVPGEKPAPAPESAPGGASGAASAEKAAEPGKAAPGKTSADTTASGKAAPSGKAPPSGKTASGHAAPPAAPPAASPAQPRADGESPEWKVNVASLRVDEGHVSFDDRHLEDPAELDLDGVRLTTGPLSLQKDAPLEAELGARWQKQGAISVKAKGTVEPLDVTLDTRLRGMDLKPLTPYLDNATGLVLGSCELSSRLTVALREREGTDGGDRAGGPHGGLDVSVEGATRLENLSLKLADGGDEFASLRRLSVRGLRFEQPASGAASLHAKEVELEKPRLFVALFKDGSTSFGRALETGGPENGNAEPEASGARTKPSKTAKGSGKEPAKGSGKEPGNESGTGPLAALDVGSLSIDGGEVRFHDERFSPVFTTEATDITGKITGISQDPSTSADVKLSASIEGAPLKVAGKANALASPPSADLHAALSGLDLVPFSPYAVEYVAYPVEHGRLSYDVAMRARKWVLRSDNRITLSGLELGSKDDRPGAPDYPVKLALALMEDLSGDVDLDLPVQGRMDDPDFRFGGLVGQALQNLMLRVVTSPFALVGNLLSLGMSGVDMRRVDFSPGSAALNDAAQKDLSAVAEVLRKRPRLSIEVRGVADTAVDTEGLKEQALLQSLREAKYASLSRRERARTDADHVTIEPDEYDDLLEEVYDDAPFDKPENLLGMTKSQPDDVMESALKEHHEVTPEEFKRLAEARAKAVRERLLQLDPGLASRVLLSGARVVSAPSGAETAGERGGGHVELELR